MTNKTLKRLTAISLAMLCSACGTFKLADTIVPHESKTADQQQLDTLACKDQANLSVNSAGRQTADFLLGLTIVGAPVAYAMDKSKQREVFANCMAARGYTTTLGQTTVGASSVSPMAPSIPPGQDTVVAARVSSVSLSMPLGWSKTAPPVGSTALLHATNKTIDAGVLVDVIQKDSITDTLVYTQTVRANLVGRLSNATASEIAPLEIGGRKAYRFSVAGELKSKGAMNVTFLATVIEGTTEVATLNTWTGTANFSAHHEAMEHLADSVTGL